MVKSNLHLENFDQTGCATLALPLIALLVAGCAALAVGDARGWSLNGVNYTSWASGRSFAVGDKLVFSYVYKQHAVTEVSSKSTYDAYSGNGAVSKSNDDSGWTTVTLTTPGMHYFICNTTEHCTGGMKLATNVSATPSGTAVSAAATQAPAAAMASAVAAAAGAAIKLALF